MSAGAEILRGLRLATSGQRRRDARFRGANSASVPLRLANRVAGIAPRPTFTAGQLIDDARRATGLRDLGDEFFVPALQTLVLSIHREARLTPLGALIQRKRLTDLLKNRLRIEAAIARRPDLLEAPLLPAVVIAGLQRTGTTLLHRLLSSHPRARSLPSWECLNPAPLPGDTDDRKRRALARQAELGLRIIAPDFFAIHPVEADSPEEDVLLLELSFMSQTSEALMHVPSYSSWLEAQDQTPAYAYLVRVLKLLQARTPNARHWVLKTPHHLEWLDILLHAMPGARIVQTHRNPLLTTASFASMVAHGRAVFSDSVDPTEVGRHWLRKIGRVLERAHEARARAPEAFVDVDYEDLVGDPQRTASALQRECGWSTGVWADLRVRETLARSKQGRFGHHTYRLDDFGLDEGSVRAALGPYMEAHGY